MAVLPKRFFGRIKRTAAFCVPACNAAVCKLLCGKGSTLMRVKNVKYQRFPTQPWLELIGQYRRSV